MSDYIKRKDVVELLNNSYVQEDGRHNWRDHNNDCIDRLIEKVKAIPSARPKGEWIDRSDGGRILHPWWESYECNQCGYEGSGAWNFCPNCGSDNREREDE